MRLLLFLFVLSTSALAQDVSSRFSALEKQFTDEAFAWRAAKEVSENFHANDEYVTFRASQATKYIEAYNRLHTEVCKTGVPCPDKNQKVNEINFGVGVLRTQNRFHKEGKTSDAQIAEAEALFRKCAEEQKDCDKLSPQERESANISRATPPVVAAVGAAEASPEGGAVIAATGEEVVVALDPVVEQIPEIPASQMITVAGGTSEEKNEDESAPKNYDSSSCEWVEDLPRKIVNGPGCSVKNRNKICTGYVKCKRKDKSEGVFIRMSTCRPEFCDKEDAKACTEDMLYFSQKPEDEDKLFIKKSLKEHLSPSASRQ